LVWLTPSGTEMRDEDWRNPLVRCLGMLHRAEGQLDVDAYGRPVEDEEFLLLLNAHHEPIEFALPKRGGVWRPVFDTAAEACALSTLKETRPDRRYRIEGRTVALLRIEMPG